MDVDVKNAVKLLKKHQVIGIPTDTVYGLAVLAGSEYKIYQLKSRNRKKPLIKMFSSLKWIPENQNAILKKAKQIWPGDVTLIYPEGKDLISCRIPDEPNLLELLKALDCPILTTSANVSGQKPALTREEFYKMFPKVPLLVEKKNISKKQEASTILVYNRNRYIKIR